MRIAIFDYVPSSIMTHVILPDWVDVTHFRALADPVKALRKVQPVPDAVYVNQPPGATIGYAVAAQLRDAFPGLRIVGVRTADAHREGFLAVGCDAVIDPAGIEGDVEKLKKQAEKDAAKEAEAG